MQSSYRLHRSAKNLPRWRMSLASYILLLTCCYWVTVVRCMTGNELNGLRQETIGIFYHGYDNYMTHAFPEDELKPLSCTPLTRDRTNPGHVEVNDVLGNYSLTLVDSLSTLAILASSNSSASNHRDPLRDFQDGIAALVSLYGDGTDGSGGQGMRGKGFDLDSKVQVFETVIRGVGGLLSAHLFAIGELPISGYRPKSVVSSGRQDIPWPNGFTYNGQLLRLAYDLASRLLPAFHSMTGLPYPRVNLRHGIPFYLNSPLNYDAEHGQYQSHPSGPAEITETCSAGAGSLVLEFTVLSRLTGDVRFENLAKKAFWAVWGRRSFAGLVGSGIDAETGDWVSPFTGIGAGIDSFFEYALKSHILLAGSSLGTLQNESEHGQDFLSVWRDAHASIKRHLYRGSNYQAPHYVQGDLYSGATRAFWIDSLSAYYPGLLTLAGELDEAVETYLLYAALWTRYSALPERWSTATGNIDSGLRWWGGRPEFIESTWYLFRATQDPWYLHVGEMVVRDIKRRCWTPCGWAGLEDVRNGELKDRMESFFLGETAKYLYLLFDSTHPLNRLDAPFVFTTEGHPLIIPRSSKQSDTPPPLMDFHSSNKLFETTQTLICPAPPPNVPFSISAVTSRTDFFHAACLARLHRMPNPGDTAPVVEFTFSHPSFANSSLYSPNNYTHYPWTLPAEYILTNGTSSKMESRITFDISFPALQNAITGLLALQRLQDGFIINSISGLKLSLIKETERSGHIEPEDVFRIYAASGLTLGRDEKVYMNLETIVKLNPVDQYFTRHRDSAMLDVVVDVAPDLQMQEPESITPIPPNDVNIQTQIIPESVSAQKNASSMTALLQHFSSAFEQQIPFSALLQAAQIASNPPEAPRPTLAAAVAIGIGAGPIPDVADSPLIGSNILSWTTIYLSDQTCEDKLPASAPRDHQIIVMKRGGCNFSKKLTNIPSFAPFSKSLQLVIVVSYPENEADGWHIRPLLDEVQHTPSGMPRFSPVPLIMVEGGHEAYELLKSARGVGLRRRYQFSSQGLRISNVVVV